MRAGAGGSIRRSLVSCSTRGSAAHGGAWLRRVLDAFVRPRALVTPYLAQSWPGIGHVAVGMHRQGFDLQLTQYDERGWRATF